MKVEFNGVCLGGGCGRVRVSQGKKFSIFIHHNGSAPARIPLKIENIYTKNHLVFLKDKREIRVVEHLFSALYGLGLFNVKIAVLGNEIPFFDGSSREFAEKLVLLKKKEKTIGSSTFREVFVKMGGSFIHYKPNDREELEIDMEISHPYIKKQRLCLKVDDESYLKEIAPARTFIFTTEDDPRIKNPPPYGIGITQNNIYSKEPLRFSDEFVRHKILDLLGDLYVLQKRLSGKVTASNTSHLLNIEFIRKIQQR